MRIIDHGSDAVGHLSEHSEAPAGASVGAVEVTPAMIWAALEEWAGFDDARDDLDRFLARIYQAMEAVRRDTVGRRIPAVTYADLRYLP